MTDQKRNERIAVLVERIGRDQAELAGLLGVAAEERRGLTLGDLAEPVACVEVAGVLGKRSDKVLWTLRNEGMRVIKARGIWHCQIEDAAKLWPKFRRHLREREMYGMEVDGV